MHWSMKVSLREILMEVIYLGGPAYSHLFIGIRAVSTERAYIESMSFRRTSDLGEKTDQDQADDRRVISHFVPVPSTTISPSHRL